MSDYQTALRTACADLGAICALLGFENYPGIDALLKTITNLIADRRLASDWQAPAVEAHEREVDAHLIDRMSKLLAEIALILNGEPAPLARPSYHDLPDKVRALQCEVELLRSKEAKAIEAGARDERASCASFKCALAQRDDVPCRDGECERAQIDGAPCWDDECDIVMRGSAAPSSASEAAKPADDDTRERIARALHYPACWDTAAYPTLDSASWEAIACAKLGCSTCDSASEAAAVTTAEFETAIETLRHVIDCLRGSGSYTDEEGEATDFLEPLLNARLAAPQPAPEATPESAGKKEHRPGCEALGGYGHGVGPCDCGADAAPQPASDAIEEGCTPADAKMLRTANHSLADENAMLRHRLRPFALLATPRLSWAMVEYCIDGDPEKQTLQAPQMQRAFNRAAEALADELPSHEPVDCEALDLPDWVKNAKPPAPDQPASEQHDTAQLAGELWRAAAEKELLELANFAGSRLTGPFQSGFLQCVEEIATRLHLSEGLRNFSKGDASEQQAARRLNGEQIIDAWLRTGHSKDEFRSFHYDFALNVLASAKGDGHADK